MTARLCVGVSLGACAVSSDQATTGMSTHGNPDCSLSHSHPVATLPGTPGRLAQLGERRLDKAEVTGSSPVSPTLSKPRSGGVFSFSWPRAGVDCRLGSPEGNELDNSPARGHIVASRVDWVCLSRTNSTLGGARRASGGVPAAELLVRGRRALGGAEAAADGVRRADDEVGDDADDRDEQDDQRPCRLLAAAEVRAAEDVD